MKEQTNRRRKEGMKRKEGRTGGKEKRQRTHRYTVEKKEGL